MSLPSSGQISWGNIADEMGVLRAQVGIGQFSQGTNPGAPINVNTVNSGKYPLSYPRKPTQFYGYNASVSIPPNGTNGLLFITDDSSGICYPRAMLVFYMGTTNGTYTISYNYTSSPNYGIENKIIFYYGFPNGDNQIIYQASAAINTQYTGSNSFLYNYVYNSGLGQYIYAVVVGRCP